MKTAAVAVAVLALAGSASGAPTGARVAYVHDGELIVLDVATGASQIVMRKAPEGPVAWSGDGALLSDGGHIVGGPSLPAEGLAWAPDGETAAYLTASGAVHVWTTGLGERTILPASWGARSLAWGPGGELAIGRKVVRRGRPFTHQEVWVWRDGALRLVAGPIRYDTTPIVEGFDPRGRVLWWDDGYDSASIMADGLELYANRTPLGRTLVFGDTVHVCGSHLVYQLGTDRYTTKGKSIVYDGRDLSRDPTRSWVSPSCNGAEVVAAAGRNWWEPRIGRGELRSIWELEPTRERLTRPPARWTDEFPTVLPDGSVLFVRTHATTSFAQGQGWTGTLHASLELYSAGAVKPLASLTTQGEYPYYGHYPWPQLVAVTA